MQENNFIHVTTGITQVIEAEEKLLSSLPVEVITQRRNATESHHQADSRSLD